MNFEIGDVVVMNSHCEDYNESFDDVVIPIGSTGTIVFIDDLDLYERDEDISVGVSWDLAHSGEYGSTYTREFWNAEEDRYINYLNVWFVAAGNLKLAEVTQRVSRKEAKIINKIKQIDKKVKEKRLPIRKIKPITFPDKKVPV